jgi:predicted alpha/beta-hydrolase family hydrolase
MKPAALLLTPGASANRDHRALVAIEGALAPMPVARVDFPSRKKPPVIIEHIGAEAKAFTASVGIKPGALALGGRSMGGRMCSLAVAEGLPAAALVLLSYPLHPPGRPDSLRVDHFSELRVPCLFVSGTKDPFGTPTEFERHTVAIPGPVTHVWLDGGAHDPKGREDEVAAIVQDWLRGIRATRRAG